MAEYVPSDSSDSFFNTHPPHWAVRGLACLLILVFLAAVLFCVAVPLPDVVSCAFVLVPSRGTDPVRARREGTIEQLCVREGQTVEAGAVVCVVRSAEIGQTAADLATREVENRAANEALEIEAARFTSEERIIAEEQRALVDNIQFIQRLLAETASVSHLEEELRETARQIAHRELTRVEQRLPFQQNKLSIAQENLARYTALRQRGAASAVALEAQQLEFEKTSLELTEVQAATTDARLREEQALKEKQKQRAESTLVVLNLERQLQDRGAELTRSRHQHEVARRAHELTAHELRERVRINEQRIAALREELRDCDGEKLTVRAPCGGPILRMHVRDAGAVVKAGDVICEMTRNGDRPRAELDIPASGAGRVKEGLTARLKYDAFPYQRYGTRQGIVQRVISPSDRSIKAFVEVTGGFTTAAGRQPLIPGMTGQTDVVVDRQPLIVYFLRPFRELRKSDVAKNRR